MTTILLILLCIVMVLTPRVSFYSLVAFVCWVTSISLFPALVLFLFLYKRF